MSGLDLLLAEMSLFISKQYVEIAECYVLHRDDAHVLAEISAKEQVMADFVYFYNRLAYEAEGGE